MKHISRCRILLHCVDPLIEEASILSRIEMINQELIQYGHDCAQKDQIILVTKMDCLDHAQQKACIESLRHEIDGHQSLHQQVKAVLGVSSQQGLGIDELKEVLVDQLGEKWD